MTNTRQAAVPLISRLSRWEPVRFFCYVTAIILLALVAKILTAQFIPAAPSPLHDSLMLFRNATLLASVFTIYALLVHLLERRAAFEIDPRAGMRTFPTGILIGSAAIGSVYLILWGLGMAHFAPNTGAQGLALALVYHTATAMFEELVFRGILFRLLERVFGTAAALLASVVIFGLAHAGNPGATVWAMAALGIGLGTLVTLAYILTGNIWLAVGIHLSWNFMQGYVFGAEVSGLSQPKSILIASLSGPDLLTGGHFGPEGSALSAGAGLVACAILIALIRRGNVWRPLHFQLRQLGPINFAARANK